MLNLPANLKIFLSTEPCDMRRQMDGLAGMVRARLGRDPTSGDLFVFANKRKDMVKILFCDDQGYCLLAKRMNVGVFQFYSDSATKEVQIDSRDLAELLRGAAILQNNFAMAA